MAKTERSYYQSLYEVAAAVNSARTPDSVLCSIVENVAKAMNSKGCSLMLLTPDKKLLFHAAAYGLSDAYIKKGLLSAEKSIAEALEGKPVSVLDAASDERIQYREEAKREGIASIFSVPIKLRGEIIGVIRVYSAEQRQFSQDDSYFISAVANLGAISLENARLYESCLRDVDTLKHYYFPFL